MYTTLSNINTSSLLDGCNGEVKQSITSFETILLSILFVVMIIFAIHGNIFVILAIIKNKELRTPKNSFLCSLAFIDLLSPIFRVLPIAISTMEGKWMFGCSWCVISSAAGVFFCSSAILHLCAITVERFITVSSNQQSSRWITKINVSAALGLIWLLALIMALMPYKTPNIHLYFNNRVLFCDFYLGFLPELSIIMTSLYFCLPVVLMLIVYCRISKQLDKSNQKMMAYRISQESYKKHRTIKREWKTVKLVIAVIGSFIILWCPYFTVACIKSYHPKLLPGWVERFALVSAYLNACSNFIVYSIMNRKLRQTFKRFYIWKIMCKSSLTPKNGIHEQSITSIKAIKERMRKAPDHLLKKVIFSENKNSSAFGAGDSIAVITIKIHESISCVLEKDLAPTQECQILSRDRGNTF